MLVYFHGARTSWTARITTATDRSFVRKARSLLFLLLLVPAAGSGLAQGIRDRTRPSYPTDAAVTESQAADLTLTLTQAAVRPIQTWVRAAGVMDKDRKMLTAVLYPPHSELIKVGQRARAFTPDSKSSMYQARVARVEARGGRTIIHAALMGQGREDAVYYVIEIVVDRGELLSVPNEAIIEEGDRRIVYVQRHPGHYEPQEIHTGIHGELYTEVLHGLADGDQIVTVGSFFVDSEYKLNAAGQAGGGMGRDQHHH